MMSESMSEEAGEIIVNLYGGLEKYSPDNIRKGNTIGKDRVDSIADILNFYSIPDEEVQVILVDGKHAERESSVSSGSNVSIFPLVGGG